MLRCGVVVVALLLLLALLSATRLSMGVPPQRSSSLVG